jgi:hypothetical protein
VLDELRIYTEEEELLSDSQKLRMYQKDMKITFLKNIDSLHLRFLSENLDIIDEHDAYIVRRVFQFLKENA